MTNRNRAEAWEPYLLAPAKVTELQAAFDVVAREAESRGEVRGRDAERARWQSEIQAIVSRGTVRCVPCALGGGTVVVAVTVYTAGHGVEMPACRTCLERENSYGNVLSCRPVVQPEYVEWMQLLLKQKSADPPPTEAPREVLADGWFRLEAPGKPPLGQSVRYQLWCTSGQHSAALAAYANRNGYSACESCAPVVGVFAKAEPPKEEP